MIALIGNEGMLGGDIAEACRHKDMAFMGFDLPTTDIGDYELTRQQLLEAEPEVVVNCAAYTAVDRAESDPDTAARANTAGPANLAVICDELDIPLIHISTDYVFDGCASSPYTEQDMESPQSVYGRTKLEGERRIRDHLDHHVIIRTSWLYGVYGSCFVNTMRRLGLEHKEFTVVDDQWGSPTWAADLADVILTIIKRLGSSTSDEMYGTFHYTGFGKTTWRRYAEVIVEECRRHEHMKVQKIIPITTAERQTPAKRPAYSVLDCSKIKRVFDIGQQNWQSSLSKMLDRFYEGLDAGEIN